MNLAQPTWVTPSAPGQLTNKFGSNASTDAIGLSALYRSPTGDSPSGVRVLAQRNAIAGTTTPSPNYIWDTDWVGTSATSPMPVPSGTVFGANSTVVFGGRVYVLVPQSATPATFAIAGILSAPVNGGNVGAWRWETAVQATGFDPYNNPYWISDSCSPGAMCRIYNYLYVLGLAGVYYAQFNADGTIGTWQQGLGSAVNGPSGAVSFPAGSMMAGWQNTATNGSGWDGGIMIASNAATTPMAFYPTSITYGWPYESASFTTSLGTGNQVGYGSLWIDPYYGTFILGGEGSTGTPTSQVWHSTINYGTGTVGAWSGTGTNWFPAARSRFAFAAYPSANGSADSTLYIMGGVLTSGGAAQSTVWSLDAGSISAGTGSWGVWTALGTATSGGAGAISLAPGVPQATSQPSQTPQPPFPTVQPYQYLAAGPGTYKGFPALLCMGGSATSAVQSASAEQSGPWTSGAAAALTAGSFGTGGSVTASTDGSGSVTLGFAFADATQSGFGVKKNMTALSNGDQVQVGVQFASQTTGDVTPISWTIFTVGQPPSCALTIPTSAGLPTPTTMSYTAGAGGSIAANWRLKVVRNSDAALMFDSGQTNGGPAAGLVQVMCAPALASGIAYNATLYVTSQDTPMAGSTNAASATQSVTPSYTAAGSLTGLSVTPNNALGYVSLSWTPVAGANYYRVYYRVTGTSTWTLLIDNVTNTPLVLRDRIPLGQSIDYTVSAAKTLGLEGPQPAAVSATLNPALGGYSSMLHVAGGITTTPLYVPLLVDGSPTIKMTYDSVTIPLQGQAQPVIRVGLQNWRNLSFDDFVTDNSTVLGQLQGVINAALGGAQLYYRDSLGECFPVGIDKQSQVAYQGFIYRKVSPNFVQIADTFGAFVSAGSALGIPALVGGSLPPLSPGFQV